MTTAINTTSAETIVNIITLADGNVQTTVTAGDTVMTAVSKVSKVSLETMDLTINGKPAKKDDPVKAGDTVTALPKVEGGKND